MLDNIKNWWKQERKSSKVLMIFSCLFIAVFVITIANFGISFAAALPETLVSDTLFRDDGYRVNLYPELRGEDIISLTPFVATDTSSNTYHMYCLERTLEWYDDATVTKGEQLDSGYAYIIQHGYPTVSLTDEGDWVNSYLTQVAIWLYQDRSQGVLDTVDGSLTANQKRAIMQNNTYYPIIDSLVTGAIDAKENYSNVTPSITVSSGDFHLDSSATYLETNYLSVSSNVSFKTYTVALDMANAQVVNEDGDVISSNDTFTSGEKFKIRLPLAQLDGTDLDLKISITTDYEMAVAYQYNPPAEYDDMQKSMASAVTIETRSAVSSTTVVIPTGSLTIEKVDSVSNNLLPGAEIEVYRVIGTGNEKMIDSFTTSNEAKVISNLLPGQYKVVEKSAPDGYLIDVSDTSVLINASNLNVTARLMNELIDIKVQIQKVDEDTNLPLAGAVIKIVDSTGKQVTSFTSENGYTTISGLDIGKYQAIEVSAPDGYYLDSTPVDFEVTAEEQEVSITMKNKKNLVQILKTDQDGEAIAGAVLRVVNADTGASVDQWTTSTEAHDLTGIAPGNYRVEEVSPPSGYALNSNSIPFTITNTMTDKIEIHFPNTKSQIMISKVDEQGQTLAGAKLEIYNESGDKVYEFTSEDTPTVIEKLEAGRYTLREVDVPDGYQLNKEPVSFEVAVDTTNLQVTMKNVKNSVSFYKIDRDTEGPVSGAVLRLVDEEGEVIDEWTTDNEAHVIEGLKNGTYYLEEVSAPNGYIRNTERIEVVVDDNTTTSAYTMFNQSIAVRIGKVDSETKDLVAGATLELLNSNYEVISTWTTTTEYRVFDNLSEGKYYVRETIAPKGYVLNDELLSFTVEEDNPSVTVSFEDKQTTVKLGKVDANTGNYVAGAVLKLSRQDGTMDDVTFVSEEKATVFRGLASGVYILEEVSAPDGYITSNSKITFELDNLGKTKNIALKSDLISISVSNKRLEIDTNGVDGYEFQLMSHDGSLLDTYSISDEVFVSDVLENGNYLLKQTKVPDGVVLNNNAYSFVISDSDGSDVVYFTNDYTKVDFEKKEMIGDKQLAGGHFILRNEEGDMVAEWDSTDTAKRIEKLVPGTYTLSEVSSPDGYQLDDSLLTFQVNATADVQTVTMFNALKVDVPNTSENSLLYLFVGTVIMMTGFSVLGYVYFKRRGDV